MSDMTQTEPEDEAPLSGEEQERLVRERYEKAARAIEEGKLELFVNRFVATHHAGEIAERKAAVEAGEDAGGEVVVAGRVVGVRSFGKAGFIKLRDASGDVQVYVKSGVIDEAGFELYKKWLDMGDIVGVTGTLFITRTGELTIEGHTLQLLTKSMRPLPGKWHGLRDVELRYRQRYVDLIVNPEVAETFRKRSRAIAFIRRFLDERGYIEVETPMMQAIYGGAAARPFKTQHNALDMPLYLRIAPELYLKRLIVGGLEKVYEINRNFRNEGVSTRHNPEFTMLELYTQGWDYNDTMTLTEELIREAASSVIGTAEPKWGEVTIDLGNPFRRLKILDAVAEVLLKKGCKFDLNQLRWGIGKKSDLFEILGLVNLEEESSGWVDSRTQQGSLPVNSTSQDHGEADIIQGEQVIISKEKLSIYYMTGKASTSDEAIMAIFEAELEQTLIQPTFVIDYPKSLCPLTKSMADDPLTAERFELYIGGIELANAYSELNDPAEQLRRFEEQVAQKAAGDDEAMSEVDRDYVRALEYGMPPCSGLGIGIDRLVMMLTDSASIRDVILFPLMRAER